MGRHSWGRRIFVSTSTYDIDFETRQWVFLSGFPGSLNGTRKLTSGFRFSRDRGLLKTTDNFTLENSTTGYELIYTNLTQRGMSGGPLLDANGQVIGINAAVEQDTRGAEIGYAVGVPASNLITLAKTKGIPLEQLNITTIAPLQLTQAEVASLKTHPSFAVEEPPSNAKASDWLTYGNQLWRLEKFNELAWGQPR